MTTINTELHAARGTLRGIKYVLTGLAVAFWLVVVSAGWAQAFADEDGVAALAQAALGTVLVSALVWLAWALLMLPVRLLLGVTANR